MVIERALVTPTSVAMSSKLALGPVSPIRTLRRRATPGRSRRGWDTLIVRAAWLRCCAPYAFAKVCSWDCRTIAEFGRRQGLFHRRPGISPARTRPQRNSGACARRPRRDIGLLEEGDLGACGRSEWSPRARSDPRRGAATPSSCPGDIDGRQHIEHVRVALQPREVPEHRRVQLRVVRDRRPLLALGVALLAHRFSRSHG